MTPRAAWPWEKLDAAKPGSREKLGLTADVTVVGAGDHFEVWNTQKWDAAQASFEDDLDRAALPRLAATTRGV